MVPSTDQQSSTPTPTDPDLQFTPLHPSNPSHSPQTSMHMQNQFPHDLLLEMNNLKQLWGRLSLEHNTNENASYVHISMHTRVAIAWNLIT